MIGRLITLPVKGIGQGDVLDVFWQIRFYVEINRHFPTFIGSQRLLGKTETFGLNKIQTGLGRRDVIGCLPGNGFTTRVHRYVQTRAGYAQVVLMDLFLCLEYPW